MATFSSFIMCSQMDRKRWSRGGIFIRKIVLCCHVWGSKEEKSRLPFQGFRLGQRTTDIWLGSNKVCDGADSCWVLEVISSHVHSSLGKHVTSSVTWGLWDPPISQLLCPNQGENILPEQQWRNSSEGKKDSETTCLLTQEEQQLHDRITEFAWQVLKMFSFKDSPFSAVKWNHLIRSKG
jgi:hypothetical protein